MTRPALTLLTAVALLWQAWFGVPSARAGSVAAPICHVHDERGPAPAGAPHDCLACPICAGVTQSPMVVPPTVLVPRPSRVAMATIAVWSARPVAIWRSWPSWPRGPPGPA